MAQLKQHPMARPIRIRTDYTEQDPAKRQGRATFKQPIPNQQKLRFQTFGGNFESQGSNVYVLLQRTSLGPVYYIHHFTTNGAARFQIVQMFILLVH